MLLSSFLDGGDGEGVESGVGEELSSSEENPSLQQPSGMKNNGDDVSMS